MRRIDQELKMIVKKIRLQLKNQARNTGIVGRLLQLEYYFYDATVRRPIFFFLGAMGLGPTFGRPPAKGKFFSCQDQS